MNDASGVRIRGCGDNRWPSRHRPAGRARSDPFDERGSIIPLLAIVAVALAMVLGMISVTARHYVRVAEAQWAADSVALAVAAEGPHRAGLASGRALAEANGARLLSVGVTASDGRDPGPFRPGPGRPTPAWPIVVVEVERRGIAATAAAQRFRLGVESVNPVSDG